MTGGNMVTDETKQFIKDWKENIVHACRDGYTLCGIEINKLPKFNENGIEIFCSECMSIMRKEVLV